MKPITLALCTTLMFGGISLAQQPPPTPDSSKAVQTTPENYVVNLIMTDKEKTTEVSLVVASADFTTTFLTAQSGVTSFQGTLTPKDGNTVAIKYALGGQIAVSVPPNGTNYVSTSTQTMVLLKLGEPIQILKSDARTCTLSISRLSDQEAKGK